MVIDETHSFFGKQYLCVCDPWDGELRVIAGNPGSTVNYDGNYDPLSTGTFFGGKAHKYDPKANNTGKFFGDSFGGSDGAEGRTPGLPLEAVGRFCKPSAKVLRFAKPSYRFGEAAVRALLPAANPRRLSNSSAAVVIIPPATPVPPLRC